ncbi:MAG TPA: sulfatase [Planctomycetota bacterium]|nr:sulfatase [Planctomycetota bacterium]
MVPSSVVMPRRLLALLLALVPCACRDEPPPDNLLLVMIDTLRADHLGAWGYPYPTSPRLDALARDGVRVSRFYSTSAWTRPGVASLLTGEYPRTTGIYEERFDALAPELETLAERLRARGYATLGVTANPNINAWFGFDQGCDLYGDSGVVWPWMPAAGDARRLAPGVARLDDATAVTDRALEALDRLRSEQPGKPFYLQLLYVDPHLPYEPPAGALQALVEAGSRHAAYDGEIRHTDAEIGRLLDGLESRGLLGSTLVVVTSDHGEGLDDHPNVPRSYAHGNIVYDSVLHVPLLLSHPDLPPGRVVETLASSIDLVPTVLELLGRPLAPQQVAGRSLVPLLRGGDPAWDRDRVFSETDWRATRKLTVRTASRRFIRNDDSLAYQREGVFEGRELDADERRQLAEIPPQELYEERPGRAEDPASSNVVASEAERAAQLAADLARWERAVPARAPLRRDPETDVLSTPGGVVPRRSEAASGEPAPAIDPELEERLRALGYLEGGH